MKKLLAKIAVPVMAVGVGVAGLSGSAFGAGLVYNQSVSPSNGGAYQSFAIDTSQCATQSTGTDCDAIETESCIVNGVIQTYSTTGVFWEDSNFFSSNANGSSVNLCGSYQPVG